MERRLISERTRAGLHAARARGRRGGRPTVMSPDRIATADLMRARGKTLVQIAATLGIGRSSLVRALAAPQRRAAPPAAGCPPAAGETPPAPVPGSSPTARRGWSGPRGVDRRHSRTPPPRRG